MEIESDESNTERVYTGCIVASMGSREPWAEGRLRVAWLQKDWAQIFHLYRQITGLSQARFGNLIDMAQPHISDVERGKRQIEDADVIARIARGLQVPEELGGAHRAEMAEWNPDPELRDRIARAYTNRRADVRIADWIERVLSEHRRAEDSIGGRELWPVVRAQLDTVTQLLPDTSGDVADRLMILAAEHAHWLSWVADQNQQTGAALAWLDIGAGWAMDAGSPDMEAWILRVRAFYTLGKSDPVRALRLGEAAHRAAANASPATASAAVHQECLAAAALGERDRARRLADRAFELALRVPDEGDRPRWLYWLDPIRARLQHAEAAYVVRDWRAAANELRDALPHLEGYPRDLAFYSAKLQDAESRA